MVWIGLLIVTEARCQYHTWNNGKTQRITLIYETAAEYSNPYGVWAPVYHCNTMGVNNNKKQDWPDHICKL